MNNPKSQNVIVNIAGDEDRKRWERLQESMKKAQDFSGQWAALDKVGEGIAHLLDDTED